MKQYLKPDYLRDSRYFLYCLQPYVSSYDEISAYQDTADAYHHELLFCPKRDSRKQKATTSSENTKQKEAKKDLLLILEKEQELMMMKNLY